MTFRAATRCFCALHVCGAVFVASGSTSSTRSARGAFVPLDTASFSCAHHRRSRATGRCGLSLVRDDDDSQSSSSSSASAAPQYRSRSTAQPDAEAEFAVGSAVRQERLDEALKDLGFDACALTDDPAFRGSAALRMYSSFILPKSEGAFATAELPQRASVIANSIAFKAREMRSHQEDWLRNHDKSLAEADKDQKQRFPLTIVLDNLRSAHNVGNILRLAEAARITNVILCGITPAPPNPKILKTALGAADYVPFEQAGSTLDVVRKLKKEGLAVWGIETTSQSTTIWKVDMPTSGVAVILGNELVGVDAKVLKECDELICLPTHGVKNSLNVATCASVVVYEALRQWDDS
mmetsp:Transcript_3049/g.8838  ORF Transcript_3049/g.8838 Transcript_3049/m.8838 type:complete len:352 (-) Transcript_3049:232-1287(-)